MEQIPANSEYYFPNKMGRALLNAFKDVLQNAGYRSLLEEAELPQYAGTPPQDNWHKDFSFQTISRVFEVLEQQYGPRGARHLAKIAGQNFFMKGLKEMGALSGIGDLATRNIPLQLKLKHGLTAVARLFSETSDQATWLEDQELYYDYHVADCPICWSRRVDKPICDFTVGYLQANLIWLSTGKDFRVRQISCVAAGDIRCSFRIDKEPIK